MAMTQEQFQAIQLQLASSEKQVLTLSNMIVQVRSEASVLEGAQQTALLAGQVKQLREELGDATEELARPKF